MAITSALQADDVGSIPTTYSSRSTLQSLMGGVFRRQSARFNAKAQTANLSSNSQAVKTFPFNGNYAGSIPASVKDVPWLHTTLCR